MAFKRINIAIDGYSGCGKSSTARILAQQLGYTYIDTGAMYRAVTLYFLDHHIPINDPLKVQEALKEIHLSFKNIGDDITHILLNGKDVENDIRARKVSDQVSQVSTIPIVRRAMVALQQQMGIHKGVVMDGRDIGTVVFPDAELKVFMTAEPEVRAARRRKELLEKGLDESEEDIMQNLLTRDNIDSSRNDSPLRKAEDAIEIDTTHLTLGEQINMIREAALKLTGH